MEHRMKNKLRSNQGASMLLALLLFLVCAVVGSVVLASATAAAGRMSELAEMDQRYYAVTSAAELLADQWKGGLTVNLVYSSSCDAITSYTNTNNGATQTDDSGLTPSKLSSDFWVARTVALLNEEFLTDWPSTDTGVTLSSEFTVTSTNNAINNLNTQVKVESRSDIQDMLKFTITNGTDSDKYNLYITVAADEPDMERQDETYDADSGDLISYKTTYTVTWRVLDPYVSSTAPF